MALDNFFDPLVGTRIDVENFEASLVDNINRGQWHTLQTSHDPHDLLKSGVEGQILKAVGGRDDPSDPMRSGEQSVRRWKAIHHNAGIGTGLVLGALRTVGEIYQKQTTAPQRRHQVRSQVSVVLRHAQGTAFSSAGKGVANFSSLRYGLSPQNPFGLVAGIIRHKSLFNDIQVSPRSYITSVDNDGQLSIKPRHKLMRDTNIGCPAAFSKVEHRGKPKNALTLFVQAIGDVAVNKVLAQQFEIIE